MKNLPDYSVVIPAYNAAAFIGETIVSVMAQTHPPMQIIVVDDGSDDDLAAALENLNAPIALFRQENRGPATATAHGFKEVKTGFVATVDADDLWQPDKIEKQFDVLFSDHNADIVFTRMSSFGKKAGAARVNDSRSGWGRSTMLLSLETYHRVGPFVDMPGFRGEMLEWIDRARSKSITTFMMEEPLAMRRLHPGSLSWGRSALQDKGYMEVVLRAMRRRKGEGNS